MSQSKEQVRQAIAKSLKLDATHSDFWVDGEDCIVVVRRFKQHKSRAIVMPDLTAAAG